MFDFASTFLQEQIFPDAITFGSWVVLSLVSSSAVLMVREIFQQHGRQRYGYVMIYGQPEKNTNQDAIRRSVLARRALSFAIILGLIFTVIFFWQPFLNEWFAPGNTALWSQIVLIISSAIAGWFVWHTKFTKNYGDFLQVLLLSTIVGFSWYARIAGPGVVQMIAIAILVGSLFRLAKDMVDLAGDGTKQAVENDTS